jgi:hypothetical protein
VYIGKRARSIGRDRYNESGRYLNEDIKAGGLDFSAHVGNLLDVGFSDLFDAGQLRTMEVWIG